MPEIPSQSMADAVRKYIARHQLLARGCRVLVAVSGGADSVALLHLLCGLAAELDIEPVVAHLDHQLRAAASRADAVFVADLARALHLPCSVGRAQVRARAARRGVSIEMAAREARYAFLIRIAREFGAACVAVAHTEDDQAETVLLRLARGAGPDGLGGMRPSRPLAPGLALIRPLLAISRARIETYLRQRDLVWREDAGNRDPSFLRNRVRHDVLPLLAARLNPQVRRAIARTADLCQDDGAWLDALSRDWLQRCSTRAGDLETAVLRTQPLAARRRVARLWLIERGMAADQLDFVAAERLDRLMLRSRGGGSVPLVGDRVVRRCGTLLTLAPVACCENGPNRRRDECVISVPGVTRWREHGLRISVKRMQGFDVAPGRGPGRLPACAWLSRDKLADRALRVRFWRAGDRMRPFGMRGSRKLQDIFTDCKTPIERRAAIPVIECDGEIVWIPGYRIAQGWAVESEKSCSLQIAVVRLR